MMLLIVCNGTYQTVVIVAAASSWYNTHKLTPSHLIIIIFTILYYQLYIYNIINYTFSSYLYIYKLNFFYVKTDRTHFSLSYTYTHTHTIYWTLYIYKYYVNLMTNVKYISQIPHRVHNTYLYCSDIHTKI